MRWVALAHKTKWSLPVLIWEKALLRKWKSANRDARAASPRCGRQFGSQARQRLDLAMETAKRRE
jgi:hypothetical protein